jgi:hypothetical protein
MIGWFVRLVGLSFIGLLACYLFLLLAGALLGGWT